MTKVSVGVDIIEIARFQRSVERHPRLISRLFSEKEINLVGRVANPSLKFASRFAAKEATWKAMSLGLGGVDFQEVEILKNSNGKPYVVLNGRAKDKFESLFGINIDLSISHTDTLAVAMVAICKR